MAAHKLLLTPEDLDCEGISTRMLARSLQEIQLIGTAIHLKHETIYPTGERFLQLITFLGCSPMIELEPPKEPERVESASRDGLFCNIHLSGSDAGLQFRADKLTQAPRCPHCRQPEPNWQELVDRWRDDNHALDWQCHACGHKDRLTGLNFRKQAGFGCAFVEIRGIYPSEAVPGEALHNCLHKLSGCDWRIMYIKE